MNRFKTLYLILILLSFKTLKAQEFFYEFNTPGLFTEKHKKEISQILSNNNINDYRVDKYSQKVLFFSDKHLSKKDINNWFNSNNYFIVHYNSGIQGKDQHIVSTIEENNYNKVNSASQKIFVFILQEPCDINLKNNITTFFNNKKLDTKWSLDNKKIIVRTPVDLSMKEIKKDFYLLKGENKLLRITEVYE